MLYVKSYCPNPGCNHSAAMESFDDDATGLEGAIDHLITSIHQGIRSFELHVFQHDIWIALPEEATEYGRFEISAILLFEIYKQLNESLAEYSPDGDSSEDDCDCDCNCDDCVENAPAIPGIPADRRH